MARVRKSELAFDAITLEGSLISPAKLAEVAALKATEQKEADYHIPKGLTLRDETARYFRIGQALFRELFAGDHPSQQASIRFTQELLRDVFAFTDIEPVSEPKVHSDRTYIVHLEALKGRVPVVVVPPADDLDHASTHLSHDRRRSAATSLQDWLNAEESALWGLCCNGEHLRLLRDNQSLTRPAYIEANLRQIFDNEDFAGFAVLWLIVHGSRFGRPGSPATHCALERWREAGSKEGLAARDRLSDGFGQALLALGNGFLSHSANSELRDRLVGGHLPLQDFFNELLRLVYRLIFLFVAEDRDLLHAPDAAEAARKVYADGYSLGNLRDHAIRRSGWNQFHDRWQGLLVVFRSLAHSEPRLGLPALGGLFETHQTPHLDQAKLSNRALMDAIFRLAWLRDDSTIVPVNWRDMETEELGSVYEGLLELTPRLTQDGRGFAFAGGAETKGNERKKTGSYYTPDSLVQVLLDSALDPVLDRIESEAEDVAAALLGVTVIDPACGSGHFLLAAARRIATRIARARTGGVPSAADYRRALRDAVRCCVHGVDRNPMAIELARVALWIETVEPGKPLGFLDANIRLGDSLLGVFDLNALEKGIPDAAYKPLTGDDKDTAKEFERRNKADKGQTTRILDFSGGSGRAFALPPLAQAIQAVRDLPEDTLEQVKQKSQRFTLAQGDPRITSLHQAADLYIAAFLIPKTKAQSLDLHVALVATTEDIWTAMRGGTVYGPRLGEARRIALQARAFHWPLEFPDVMAAGGFHVVLGNPPWERMAIQEQEFFASRDALIAEAPNAAARGRMIETLRDSTSGSRERALYEEFELALRISDASSEFARVKAVDVGRFSLTGSGDLNTYALFAELFSDLTRKHGRCGIVIPTGIAADASTAPFFKAALTKRRLFSLHDFQTGRGFFDDIGHARFKFSLLTLCYGGEGPEAPEFSFFSRTIDDLNRPHIRFRIPLELLSLMNPNTGTLPIFRTEKEAELTSRIYSRVPVLVEEAKGEIGNVWQVSFMRMFDMAYDSGSFRTAQELTLAGYQKIGSDWLLDESISHPVESATQEQDRYVSLYEGKMIHQFDHRSGTFEGLIERPPRGAPIPSPGKSQKAETDYEVEPWYWVSEATVNRALDQWNWRARWTIGYRFSTHPTNERTLILSVIPRSATPHVFPQIMTGPGISARQAGALMCSLSSLIVDFVCRIKMSRQGLDIFIVKQLPVLPPNFYREPEMAFIIPRLVELSYTSQSLAEFARDLGYDGQPFVWDEERRAILMAELDAWYAHAYALTRDELRYILSPADVMGSDYPSESFRRLQVNEIRDYGEYRTRRLVLEAWDRMEAGDLPAPQPYDAPQVAAGPAVNPLFGAGPLFEIPEAAPVALPAYTVPSTLPDGAWTMPTYNSISVQLQLTAILKKLQGPTPADRVRLAALYALRPDYLTPQLSGTERHDLQRLVGDSARVSNAVNVITFAPRVNVEWRDAYTQLRGMHALVEDSGNDTWAPGFAVQDFQTEGWPDGRAGFVLNALEGMVIERSIALLPTDVQAWVRGHAA